MTKAKLSRGRAARWANRVERLRRSGLSIRRFAAREGLRAGTLSFWKWKLAQQGQTQEGVRSERLAPLQFVELTEKEALRPAPAFEVVLSTGRKVRVGGGFDAAELGRLVGVLEEARS